MVRDFMCLVGIIYIQCGENVHLTVQNRFQLSSGETWMLVSSVIHLRALLKISR